MKKYKICKACGQENGLDEFACTHCDGMLFDEYKKEPTITKLKLLIDEDFPIPIESEDIVGREARGAKLLALMTTVSRKHAKFLFDNGKWYIEDLNSSNGTYLGTVEERVYERREIKDKETIFLSRSVEIKIDIKGV